MSVITALLLVALLVLLVRHRTTSHSPMADPQARRGYWVAVAVVAVAAVCVGLATDLAPSAVAGAGGGIVFMGYAGWVLGRGRPSSRTRGVGERAPSTAPR